ncbi:dnaJ homolog subfamily C member 30, mitochondrial-like [Lucilia sericata]|uniref:dnaJ homolog subfamily C member 30, mitochondrial-like n=1 Tax=Lucilia sericata TaxID=13632 RepID=UPI0018A821B0|nr:dnaJ homolog subfamily C member 30, mitochondrial-like [Lucilia sericata]
MFTTQRYNLIIRKILSTRAAQNSNISTGSATYNANYYEALGISKNSTQGEIKAAYYRLSMLYHPDKNQGSESAAIKFREITQAYEVLGNFRLRRLYDKGIIHTAGSQYAQATEETVREEPEVEDDPSTKFYKSRFTKSKVSDTEGRTPIYNFDEWSKAHYGKSFERRKAAKAKYERTEAQAKEHALIAQNEILLFGIAFVCVLVYLKFMVESSYDTPKARAIKAAEDKRKEKGESV